MRGFARKGQITLFILIALLIVAVVLIYLFMLRTPSTQQQMLKDPRQFISSCTKDAVLEGIDVMLPQAGFIQPKNYILDQDQKIAYLCYTRKYYESCVLQEPLYLHHLITELENYARPLLNTCFINLEKEYLKKGYSFEKKEMKFSLQLEPKRVKVNLENHLKITLHDEMKEYADFSSVVSSPVYDLGVIAEEIASQEARFCDFSYDGYMILHPEYSIGKKAIGQSETASKIYNIRDRASGKELFIAIRSCAIPPGF